MRLAIFRGMPPALYPAANRRAWMFGSGFCFQCVAVVATCLMFGATAWAAEPSAPSTASTSNIPLGQAVLAIVAFFSSAVGLFLIRVIVSLRNALVTGAAKIAREEMAKAEAEKKGGIPQPFITAPQDPPVPLSEYDEHRKRNTQAHDRMFENIRAVEEKMRKEVREETEKLSERMDLSTQRLSSEIARLTELVGEVRGTVEQMARTGKR